LELEGYVWAFDPYTDFIRPTGLRVPPRPYHLDEIFEKYINTHMADETLKVMIHGSPTNSNVTRCSEYLDWEQFFMAKVRSRVMHIHRKN
jgi:hypothetical protein